MSNNFSILVATDYSESARTAEKYAVEFAASSGSFITFLHIYGFSPGTTRGTAADVVKNKISLHENKLEELQNHCKELIAGVGPKAKAVAYECLVHSGKIGKTIDREADDVNADLIFMGTHGIETYRENLFGGHTWEMIKKRNIPVLAIPANVEFQKPEKIVFAVQGRDGEIPALKFLILLAQKFNSSITLLHVTDYTRSTETGDEIFKKFQRKIDQEITYENKLTRFTHAKDVANGISEFCEYYEANWLVMSPEKTGFIERLLMPDVSVTKKMSFTTHVPLLCIPDYYDPKYSKLWKIFEPDAEESLDEF